jgi:hypothetical protein
MMKKAIMRSLCSASVSFILMFNLLGAVQSQAATVSANDAVEIVEGWLVESDHRFDTTLDTFISGIAPFYDETNELVYFVVSLAPQGFVVVAGDDLVEPIIAVSPEGSFDDNINNPLNSMLNSDMPVRVKKVKEIDKAPKGKAEEKKLKKLKEIGTKSKNKWERYKKSARGKHDKATVDRSAAADPLDGSDTDPDSLPADEYNAAEYAAGVSDVRVAPLLGTEWSQSRAQARNCYNYYTPNQYVSGCVATAMSQIMRYHQYPTEGIGLHEKTVKISGTHATRTTRGGDGSGGPYDWSKMPLTPASAPYSLENWQMIGSLLYDAGVSVSMMYASDGSAAWSTDVPPALKGVFGYANATFFYNYPSTSETVVTINSNLQAGLPVYMDISGDGAHAVVADGFGYDGGTLYHHVNLGWGGVYDAWYNLPTVDAGYNFNTIRGLGYNIFPQQTGEILSGRIVDDQGVPVPGASVSAQAQSGGAVYSDTSDDKGYYGIIVPSATTYDVSSLKTGYHEGAVESVVTGTSGSSVCGNTYNADVTMAKTRLSLKAYALGTGITLRWEDPRDVAAAFNETVYLWRSTTGSPANSPGDETQIYSGTDRHFDDTDLTPGTTYYYSLYGDDGSDNVDFGIAFDETNAAASPHGGASIMFLENSGTGFVSKWVINASGERDWGGFVSDNPMSQDWRVVGNADLNGDGIDDLVLDNPNTGYVSKWLLSSDGLRQSGGLVHTSPMSSGWRVAGVADLNGDGIDDLVLDNSNTGYVSKWLLNSSGVRESGGLIHTSPMSPGWRVAGVADLNGDGIDDLVLDNSNTGYVSKWLLNSSGVRESGGLIHTSPMSPGWRVAGVADLNGDGIDDLVLDNLNTGYVSKWLLNSSGVRESGGLIHTSPMSPGWRVAGVADLNGDGIDDLVLDNLNTGYVSKWLLNSSGVRESGGLIHTSAMSHGWAICTIAAE